MTQGLIRLARTLQTARRPLILTGAGLSVASGLPAYRQGADAVWDRFIVAWGTRHRFLADPGAWWRQFWLKVHALTPATVTPNPGHLAVARIVDKLPGSVVVTQNIDGLHEASGLPRSRLIEIHGRHDHYHCVDPACAGFMVQPRGVDLVSVGAGEVPSCEICGALVRPTVLMFDELYDSHPYYRSAEAFAALADADVLVCIGTSYAVGVTEFALQHAVRRRVPIFHVNVAPFAEAADADQAWAAALVYDVIGPAEMVLPALAREIGA